jgi:thiol-disulfide isomerase/thioredoxin
MQPPTTWITRHAGTIGIVLVLVGGAGLAVIAAIVISGAGRPGGGAPIVGNVSGAFLEDPQPVPTLSVTDIHGGTVSSSEWRDLVTVVNLWGTWCGPCRIETPFFVRLQEQYREHVRFVGLAIDDTPEAVKAFSEEFEVNYPLALISAEQEALFGNVIGYPTTFLVNREGRIVQVHVGLVSARTYEEEIRALAGLPPLPAESGGRP